MKSLFEHPEPLTSLDPDLESGSESADLILKAEDILIRAGRVYGMHVLAGETQCPRLPAQFTEARLSTIYWAWIRVIEQLIPAATVPLYVRPPQAPLRSLHEKMLLLAVHALRANNEVGFVRAISRVAPKQTAWAIRRDLEIVASALPDVARRWGERPLPGLCSQQNLRPVVLH